MLPHRTLRRTDQATHSHEEDRYLPHSTQHTAAEDEVQACSACGLSTGQCRGEGGLREEAARAGSAFRREVASHECDMARMHACMLHSRAPPRPHAAPHLSLSFSLLSSDWSSLARVQNNLTVNSRNKLTMLGVEAAR